MDVIGIGKSFVDHVVCIKELPGENETITMTDQIWQCGGVVPTAIVTLARLGAETGIISVEGNGSYGKLSLMDFEKHNVDVSRVIIDDANDTSFSLVLSIEKNESRNIILDRGDIRDITINDLDKNYIESAKYLHLYEANDMTCEVAKWAHEKGVKVAIDIGFEQPNLDGMLQFIDVFIASEEYHRKMHNGESYKDACESIYKKGPQIVAFTLGDKGCAVFDGNEYIETPGFEVDIRDTLGAGDVFHGAFIYGLLQNWNMRHITRFANAVSAIKCTRPGGRTGIPDLKTVETFLENGKIDYSEIDKRLDYYKEIKGF